MRKVDVVCCLALAPLLGWAQPALLVEHASTYPAAAGGAAAVQLTLANVSPNPVVLQGVSTTVGPAQVRQHQLQAGVQQLVRVPTLTVPAQSRVRLLPGATEVYIGPLNQPLVAGQEFPLLLILPSTTQAVRVQVRGHE